MKVSRSLRKKVPGIVLVLFLFLPACGDDGEVAAGGYPLPPGSMALGRKERIVLALDSGTLAVQRQGRTCVSIPLSSWQLGRVDLLEDEYNYDPFPLYRPNGLYVPPAGLTWLVPEGFSLKETTATAWWLELRYPAGERAYLEVRATAQGRFEVFWQPTPNSSAAYFRLRIPVGEKEAFYGLGEYYDDVNHRGKLRAMQIELDLEIESRYNEAHVPIPLLLSTAGWGLFVESDFPGVFDVAASEPDIVETTWGTGVATTSGLTLHWLVADHPLDLTRHYYELTGTFRVPPAWVYGPLVWRNENRDQAQFESDLRAMRALDLPASGVWVDRPYARAVNSFDFDPEKFPEPERMFELAEELGYTVSLWHSPYLDRRAPATQALRSEALQRGFFPPRVGLLLNDWGEPIDFTNPAAVRWWQDLLQTYRAYGVRGFKLDYGEDVVPGVAARRNRWQFFNGSDERTMHSRYQYGYHSTYAGVLGDEGGLLLVRHAVFGDQAHGVVVWPGDLDANFAEHRERVRSEDGSEYVAVGGLPAAMIAGLNLGPSGFPLYGADTGGYRHGPPDKELFTRWFQQTALSTVMQIGTSTSDVAWEPTPANGFDNEMLDWYREYTRLHLRLFPYVWSHVHAVPTSGRAVQRPVGLAYPELEVHPRDEYLLGDDLLVAPVLRRGERDREVVFPAGRWIDWWDGTTYHGSERSIVTAPLPRLPLFLREGALVPMLRPTVDTLAEARDAAAVDSFATDPGVLFVRCAPGPRHRFRVFDGTEVIQARIREQSDLVVVELEYEPGERFRAGALFEVLGFPPEAQIRAARGRAAWPALPSRAVLEEAPHGFANDSGMWVKLSAEDPRAVVEIALPRE
jgi:alpha-D-xyloside xylohydrolase